MCAVHENENGWLHERGAVTMEHLQALLMKEVDTYSPLCRDYLSDLSGVSFGSSEAGEAWRRKLCEWCFEVADHFDFDRDVVSFALSYVDRMVASQTVPYEKNVNVLNASVPKTTVSKRSLQLIAVTSLYIAIKVHGEIANGPRRKLSIQVFVELGRNFFAPKDIEEMERKILHTLEWKVNPPTSQRYLVPLLDLCPTYHHTEPRHRSNVISGVYDVARYLTELAVCVSTFTFTLPCSATALAAIVCAMEAIHSKLPLPSTVRGRFLLAIETCTGLTLGDGNVRRAYYLLKRLCPSAFETSSKASTTISLEELESELAEARSSTQTNAKVSQCSESSIRRIISPVSVADVSLSSTELTCGERDDVHKDDKNAPRKRFRSY
jgi:Cyclin, N-terminal domain